MVGERRKEGTQLLRALAGWVMDPAGIVVQGAIGRLRLLRARRITRDQFINPLGNALPEEGLNARRLGM